MNEDLKFLAESVHEWDERFDMLCRSDLSFSFGPEWFNSKYFNGKHGYTRAQWQAARDELSGKPSWDESPEWAEWLAQDADGEWWWFGGEPNQDEEYFYYHDMEEVASIGRVLGDWRNTLERRPELKKSYTVDEVIDELDIRHEVNEAAVSIGLREWRGPEDGLPPVGIECELYTGETVEIISHAQNRVDQVAVYKNYYDDGRLNIGFKIASCFRPLYTEEDKAVEEMLAVWKRENPMLGDTMQETYARQLYRAGLRFTNKEESK